MRHVASVALLGGVVIACATAHLRPVEAARLQQVELSGGECSYEIVPLDVGVCAIREVDQRPGHMGQDRLVRCGETAVVCDRSLRCDCAQPRRLFDCEPERTVTIQSDGGITPVHPTHADGTPIPPLAPRQFEGRNEFGVCRFSMGAPYMGRCNIGGLIPNRTDEQLQIGLHVPFGEDRELCGVRLSCRCGEFTQRE